MLGVCMRYAANREEAEEILQEGFLKVFEKIEQFRSAGSFEGWVRRIMVNAALERFRTKRKVQVADVDFDKLNETAGMEEDITGKMETKELLEMVQTLPPAYRLVFNLYVFEGMKHREIASELGISEGTSKSNLSDARLLLQKAVNRRMQTVTLNPASR